MWKCGTIMILFAYCTCVPPSLLLSVLHELYSASRRSHRGAGGMTAGFRAPSVPVPLPIPMEMLYFLYLCKNWELSGVAQQCCLLRHQNYSIHDKWGALWLCRTSLKLAADDAVALLTQTIHPSAMQRWVGKLILVWNTADGSAVTLGLVQSSILQSCPSLMALHPP